jgi:hypothetical protein
MKKYSMILIVFFLVGGMMLSESCNRKNAQSNEAKIDPACMLEPETGPCKAAFERYYYDQEEKTCKMFLWGGCNGVVPFETLEECQKKCNCK